MFDSRPVSLVVNVPCELADELERIQQTEPEFLERLLTYGMIRRAVHDQLYDHLQGEIALHRPSASSLEVT